MLPLATSSDVAGSLGLTEDQLSAPQRLRIPLILNKLCSDFRYQAGCEFTPGTTTVRLISVAGRVTLPDTLDGVNEDQSLNAGSVSSVKRYTDGRVMDFILVGQDVLPRYERLLGHESAGTGDLFVVTYTHNGPVPDEVISTIASACSRYLTVDPKSAVAQSTFLSSEGYHQRMASWVADTVKLSDSDCAVAHKYRSVPSMPIVAKSGRDHHRESIDTWSASEVTW